MKCPYCLNGEIVFRDKMTNFVNGITVVTKGIDLKECLNCGKKFLSNEDIEKINKNIEENTKYELSLKQNLKAMRLNAGLSESEAANILGISNKTYLSYEKNKKMPDLVMAFKIANVFRCDINDVYKLKKVKKSVIKKTKVI
ncbi:helix-turn-helix domain-containing protein [Pelotomaculum isophthalicicum JI]|uniref:Helix-turn-helix domain-containing protein n=1 Tax=Pelotomaculum isophthalicicum JI TaxID=947010 RepID=A0A9X4JVC6_9FIRM|nr:helix-turn-helix domain-containing protein [Pelotomaculum isophthalicicum]MDF9407152.1 helix-turn-helix domain-containing protein [Pelotomaculum isophthalicicum JI]